MASSLKSKANGSGPRFCDYLNGLREEFDRQPNSTLVKSSRPRRFNIYLEGLKCEFELMTEEIEFLRKERDELKVKVEEQTMELGNVRNNFVCQRCSKSTARNITSSPLGTLDSAPPLPSTPVHSQVVPLPSPIPHASTSTFDTDLGSEERAYLTNDGVGKELRVEMMHALLHREAICCVNFSQDGKYLAAACPDGKAFIYNVQTGTLLHTLKNLLAKKDFIGAVCFSHDGKYLATGSLHNGIYIWEINTRYVRNAFKGYNHLIHSLDFSPNGRLLVSIFTNTLWLWNMRDGATKDLTPNASYTSAFFSPDGEHIAASHCGGGGMVMVWRARTGQLMSRLKAHMDIAHDVKLTPDGKGLVTGSIDKTLRYWDFSSWNTTSTHATSRTSDLDRSISALVEQTRPKREYSGHSHSVVCLAISPDSRWLASGSSDKTLYIWDISSGEVQCRLNHNDWVWSVDFSPAGHYFASGEHDDTVRIWRCTPAGVQIV